jgi:hypothetical protein
VFRGRGGDGEACSASDWGQLSADDGFRSMDLTKVSKRDLAELLAVKLWRQPGRIRATTCTWARGQRMPKSREAEQQPNATTCALGNSKGRKLTMKSIFGANSTYGLTPCPWFLLSALAGNVRAWYSPTTPGGAIRTALAEGAKRPGEGHTLDLVVRECITRKEKVMVEERSKERRRVKGGHHELVSEEGGRRYTTEYGRVGGGLESGSRERW